jgi:hypothetical protein
MKDLVKAWYNRDPHAHLQSEFSLTLKSKSKTLEPTRSH